MKGIAEARKRKGEWPKEQLFWELHPVMDWLLDKLMINFGRHEAPVIVAPELAQGKAIFLFQGLLSNKRSQPVISEWFGVQVLGKAQWQVLSFDDVLAQTRFRQGLPNTGQKANTGELAKLLPGAVEFSLTHLEDLRLARGQSFGDQLRIDRRKLKRWYDAAKYRLDKEEMTARGAQAASVSHERDEIKALYQQRLAWLDQTFTTVNIPYLRVIAVFTK